MFQLFQTLFGSTAALPQAEAPEASEAPNAQPADSTQAAQQQPPPPQSQPQTQHVIRERARPAVTYVTRPEQVIDHFAMIKEKKARHAQCLAQADAALQRLKSTHPLDIAFNEHKNDRIAYLRQAAVYQSEIDILRQEAADSRAYINYRIPVKEGFDWIASWFYTT